MKLPDTDFTDLQEISLTNGASIWWGRIDALRQPLRLFTGHECPVVLHVTLVGTVTIHVSTLNLSLNVLANEHNVVYPGESEWWLDIPQAQSCEFIQIHLKPEFFDRFSDQKSPTLERLTELVRTRQPLCLAPANLSVTPAIHTVLTLITKCPLTCSLKQLFLEAKVLELLALQLSQYEHHLTTAVTTAQPPDYEKVVEARRLLEAHFDNPPTLAELSRLVGLNEFKLKKSFKEIFGDTIYNWVLNYRFDRAYQLLQRHQLTISEVAYRVGYQHPAHFTTAFKKKFGIVPSEVK